MQSRSHGSAQLRNSQFLQVGEAVRASRRIDFMVKCWTSIYIYIVFIKLFLQNFVYRVLLCIYYSFYLNTMHSLRFDSTEHLQSTINRQISHTKKEKRLSSFDYNGTC